MDFYIHFLFPFLVSISYPFSIWNIIFYWPLLVSTISLKVDRDLIHIWFFLIFFDNTQEFSEIYFLVFNLNILFLQKLRIFKRKMRFLCSNWDLVAKFLFTYNIKYLNLLKINVAWQGTFGFYILLYISILYLSN